MIRRCCWGAWAALWTLSAVLNFGQAIRDALSAHYWHLAWSLFVAGSLASLVRQIYYKHLKPAPRPHVPTFDVERIDP